MVNRDCDCCGNIELRKVYSYYYKVMTRKGQLEWEVKNVVCKKCGFVFVSPVPDEKTLSEFYENQYVHYKKQAIDFSVEKRVSAIKKLPNLIDSFNENECLPKTFIDIGAGLTSKLYLDKISEMFTNIMVVEPNIDAKTKYSSIDQLPKGCGDVIVAYDVLHHITKPHNFLQKCASVLADNGYLILEVPNLYCYPRSPSPFFITHGEIVNHFSPHSLFKLAAKAGLKLVEMSSIKASRIDRIFAVLRTKHRVDSFDNKSKSDNVEPIYASSCMKETVEKINIYKKKLFKVRHIIDAICSKDNTAIIWGANHIGEMLLDDYNVPENAVIIDSDLQKKRFFWPQPVLMPEKCLNEIRHAKLFVFCVIIHIEDIKDWIKKNTGRSLKKDEILFLGQ